MFFLALCFLLLFRNFHVCAQIVTQFSEYSSGNGSFSRFPPEDRLWQAVTQGVLDQPQFLPLPYLHIISKSSHCICVTCHQTWHIHDNHKPFPKSLTVLRLKTVVNVAEMLLSSQELKTWTNFLQEARVWGLLSLKDVKWLQFLCGYVIVWYYDVLWFMAIYYDSLWFIIMKSFFAALLKK